MLAFLYLVTSPVSGGGGDPTSFFTQLGVAAVSVGLALMWQRDTGKQRDRVLAVVEAQTPILLELRNSITTQTESVRTISAEMVRLAGALQKGPEAEIERLREDLRAAESRLRERSGGG